VRSIGRPWSTGGARLLEQAGGECFGHSRRWFQTGDAVSWIEAGCSRRRRKKDMIIASGYTVWPREVGSVLPSTAVRMRASRGSPGRIPR